MDKYIQIFIDFIPNDKSFIDALMSKYESEFRTIGMYIEEHSTTLNCQDNEFMEELFDFLDGNGFEVIRPRIRNPYNTYPIQLIPIYERTVETITKEIEEENERFKAALEKLQSTISEYVPVQEVALSYASAETDSRYVLEYKKLLASWAFWLRICRRMELLRLVPEGRCGSTPIPRPP
jgi:hypothetical protein